MYHVDTQNGLKALADVIKQVMADSKSRAVSDGPNMFEQGAGAVIDEENMGIISDKMGNSTVQLRIFDSLEGAQRHLNQYDEKFLNSAKMKAVAVKISIVDLQIKTRGDEHE